MNNTILNPPALQKYADAIFNKGAPLNNCLGFVDGFVCDICRPDENQRVIVQRVKRIFYLAIG